MKNPQRTQLEMQTPGEMSRFQMIKGNNLINMFIYIEVKFKSVTEQG